MNEPDREPHREPHRDSLGDPLGDLPRAPGSERTGAARPEEQGQPPAVPRRGISSWAISRPIGTIMLTLTLLVLGVVYIGRVPVDLLPRIVYPQVRVSVGNPGVEPLVLEETIAKPLESALATTENLSRLQTQVSEGRVSITLDFDYGTNVDFALQDAAKNVERVRSQLPEESDPPVISKSEPTAIPIFSIAFSSRTRSLVALRQWVDQRLGPQLLSVPGVAAVDLSGGLVREILIELDPERLRGYELSVSQVIAALRAENQDVAAGRISSDEREVVGKTAGRFRSVEQIAGVLLPTRGGRVALRDIAAVRDTSGEQRLWTRLDGVPAVRLQLRKQPEANTVEVADGIRARLAQLQESGFVPPDVNYSVTFDQSGFIRDALNSVKSAAITGAVLAMLIVILFLRSFRKTFIIGVSIPLAILATFVMMGISDLTLNIMSLGGLALGTGLLLDNAIVMLENIYRRREEGGLDAVEGAHAGASEVTSAIVASTTTNLASVAPFLLLTGMTSLIFRELILTISFAILASLPLALTLVPMLAAQLGKVRFTSGLERFKPLVAFERSFGRLTDRYRRAARAAVRRRWWVMGAATGALVWAGFLFTSFESEFLPQVDNGNVSAYVRLAPGSSPVQTDRITREVEAMIRTMPGVESVFATAGGWLSSGSTAGNAGRGSIDIMLGPPEARNNMSADEWVGALQQQIDARGFAGARVGVRPPRIPGLRTGGGGGDISVRVVGDDLARLTLIGEEIVRRVRGVPGLENFQVGADDPVPLLSIELDRERARALGLDVATVGQTVRTALDGTIATQYADGNFEYDVRVRFPRDRFTSATDLGSVLLFPGVGGSAPVMLRDVARIRPTLGPTSINRENQNRVLELDGDVLTEQYAISAVADSLRARLDGLQIPDDYGLVFGGEEEAIAESNRQMALVVALAIFLVFVVLSVQYESLVDPLIILMSVPLALVGVMIALWVTDSTLSAPVFLGMIMLAGIVVNNAILLVEFIEHYRHERDVPMEEAVVEAGAVRMRPILMTTVTSVMGSMPLALGLGAGGELMRPLAIAVVGGLICSTLLTLFVVPCAYILIQRGGERVKVFLVGDRKAAAVSGEVVEGMGD
ncbi:MAG: efflux RND transporter permease subunit [Gemmatimonadetes bacterium]|nr:efflux RND transporter permease subunit [Gemmatimonadota bacterium]MCC6771908.1 efflux RND transporter permease subunit [Gemmatimonadaceae bacterium]